MGSQQFCLRWNNHQSNMLSVFDQLLQDEALVDVTLACEGVSLKAHKVVLSACSPYFQSLFLDNPCQHPIVFLKDVRYTDLKALVDFMYKGEMNVSQEQLSAVIQTAESLKVKGLADYCPESTQFRGELSCQPSKVIRNTASLGLPLSDHEAKESGAPAESSSPPPPPSCSPHHPNMTSSGLPELMKRSTSPSSKRRKAKPRKRIAENAMPSDHEDSDALDLSTMSPELMESSCMDIQDGPYEGHAFPGATPPFDSRKMSHHGSNNNNGKSVSMLHLDVEDLKPHERDYNSNQNQALGSPYGMSSQTMPNVTKVPPPLLSVMTTAPLPSTSATQASIQDLPWWLERKMRSYHCEHCKQSFESKILLYQHGCPKERAGFECEVCGSNFPSHSRYLRHREIHNPDRETFTCNLCTKTMVRLDHLRTHMKNVHGMLP